MATLQILKIPEVYQLCTRLLEEGKQVAMAEGITLPDTIVEDIMHIYAGYQIIWGQVCIMML